MPEVVNPGQVTAALARVRESTQWAGQSAPLHRRAAITRGLDSITYVALPVGDGTARVGVAGEYGFDAQTTDSTTIAVWHCARTAAGH